jgi:transcriptional regulator PpsR
LKNSSSFIQPDITLNLDLSGVIRRAVLSNAIAKEEIAGWVGRHWADTVTPGDSQVQRMIDDARASGVSPFHRVRQRFPSGLELAVEYTTVRLGDHAGLVAIGRSLEAVADISSRLNAAKTSMEREYWKLREVETRYRLLFNAASQPVLLINADDLKIMEANPAAIRSLGVVEDEELLPAVVQEEHDTFRALLASTRNHGKAPGVVLRFGANRRPWLMRASLVAHERSTGFLLQLSPTDIAPAVDETAEKTEARAKMREMIEGAIVSIEDQCDAAARELTKRKPKA